MNIEVEQYLTHSFQFNEKEAAIKSELLRQIPPVVIDLHTHMGVKKDAEAIDQRLLTNLITTYPYFPYEYHLQTRKKLWQDKEVRQVVFCFPFRDIDIRCGNDYIQAIAVEDSSFIPFLTGDPQDIDYTITELKTGRWQGIKMYPEQLWPPAQEIIDFYPPEVLAELDRQSLPAIIHLPDKLTTDFPELLDLARSFPRISFIVAHFGMIRRNLREAENALYALQEQKNIYFDSSWYSETDVITRALEILGPERILGIKP